MDETDVSLLVVVVALSFYSLSLSSATESSLPRQPSRFVCYDVKNEHPILNGKKETGKAGNIPIRTAMMSGPLVISWPETKVP